MEHVSQKAVSYSSTRIKTEKECKSKVYTSIKHFLTNKRETKKEGYDLVSAKEEPRDRSWLCRESTTTSMRLTTLC